ncbi:MAG: hypothetical protein H0T76_02425 [Nannocystis sp.]|nr:hypothetical protein [Nannocystis sp.]MBA3545317.1 hypothetical protein [Nannocystis sp.]
MNAIVSLSLSGLFSLALATACDKGEEAKPTPKVEEKVVEKKPLTDLFPGNSVELPPPLAKLTFGMTEADAEKAVPGITNKLVKLEGYQDTSAGSFSTEKGDTKALTSVRLSLPKDAGDVEKMLTEKWGAPRKTTDLGKTVMVWFNAEKGLRARLKDGFGDGKDLEFSAYMPFETLIGTDKTKFGFETTPLLGLDLAGLSKDYGQVLEVLTKEKAEKKREEMKKMFGDKMDVLGEAQASTDIHLPPTELESFRTTVWPRFNKTTGLIESIRMTVPFEGEEGGADRLMAAMKKVWGEPKEEEKYGKKLFVFSEEPFITVEDSIGRSWEIEKQAKRGK